MPTVTTITVGTTGRDYTTLQAAWDAMHAAHPNLVTSDRQYDIDLYNDSEFLVTGSATILNDSGKVPTTDATRYVRIRAATGQAFSDHANKLTNARDYNQSYGVGIRCTGNYNVIFELLTNYTRIERLQIYYDSTYGSQYYALAKLHLGTDMRMDGCLLKSRQGDNGNSMLWSYQNNHITNTIFIPAGGTGLGAALVASGGSGNVLHNCTIVRPSNLSAGSNALKGSVANGYLIKNTKIFGFTALDQNSVISSSSERTCTDVASAPGTSNQVSKTFGNQFMVTTESGLDLRVKAGADSIANGSRDQTYTNDLDIIGRARSTTAPGIGAEEFIPTAPVLSLPGVQDITSTAVRPKVTITF